MKKSTGLAPPIYSFTATLFRIQLYKKAAGKNPAANNINGFDKFYFNTKFSVSKKNFLCGIGRK